MEKEDLHVGQRVWVHNGQGGRHADVYRAEVVKIGRTLVHLGRVRDEGTDREHVDDRLEPYRIKDCHENIRNSRYWFETDEQRGERLHRAEVDAYLDAVGIRFSQYKARITDEHKERLVAFLKGLGYGAE